MASIREALKKVYHERMRNDLYHLCHHPLRYRKANYTRSGQTVSTLDEADRYICSQLEQAGCDVHKTTHQVQAFRCDESKPIHHWYSTPDPADPWYEVSNIEAVIPGTTCPDEIIQLISHKDSMSWIDSPGAHDNATGTVANIELARILCAWELRRTVRILFCNEEHTPWTSQAAAQSAAERGDNIVAVLNVDSLDGKSDQQMQAGTQVHTVTYSTEEGRDLAQFVLSCGVRCHIDLDIQITHKEHVNDDDGMFIKAGFTNTIMNVGTFPYVDSQYHLPGDTAERVDIDNLCASTKLILASVLELDNHRFGDSSPVQEE